MFRSPVVEVMLLAVTGNELLYRYNGHSISFR